MLDDPNVVFHMIGSYGKTYAYIMGSWPTSTPQRVWIPVFMQADVSGEWEISLIKHLSINLDWWCIVMGGSRSGLPGSRSCNLSLVIIGSCLHVRCLDFNVCHTNGGIGRAYT